MTTLLIICITKLNIELDDALIKVSNVKIIGESINIVKTNERKDRTTSDSKRNIVELQCVAKL